jgi:ferredoxin
MPYVVTSACNQCGACIAGCENDAITEGETQSHIDPNKCIECGTCEANCPFQAIIFVQDDGAAGQTAQSATEKA